MNQLNNVLQRPSADAWAPLLASMLFLLVVAAYSVGMLSFASWIFGAALAFALTYTAVSIILHKPLPALVIAATVAIVSAIGMMISIVGILRSVVF